MNKTKLIVAFLLVVALISLVCIFIWWSSATSAPSSASEEKTVIINRGSSAEKIGGILKEAGVIKNTTAFKLYLQKENLNTSIPPGKFKIPQNLNLSDVIEILLEGPVEKWVTVPEGLRREQVPALFADVLELEGVERQEFIVSFLLASSEKEGFLFPDTYLVDPDVTATAVVSMMENTFSKKVTEDMVEALSDLGFSLDEGVIMASLLERETLTGAERPIVAGILFNRLEAGWPLQVDAAVQYAMANVSCGDGALECAEWWPRLTKSTDLELDSPYNVYLYSGLPPSPIASPGFASLEAVAFPERSDYWFYLHDPDGNIHYSRSLEEHNQNIARYLR